MTFFLSNLISLWTSRFQHCFLTITGVDLLIGSIVYCKIRWGFNMAFACICLLSIDRLRHLVTLKRTSFVTIVISLIDLVIFFPDAIYYSD